MIDNIDRDILGILRRDGRRTQREIGREVGLSPNAAGARVARLFDRGIVTGIHAKVDHKALGRTIEASIDVWVNERTPDHAKMTEFVAGDDRVVECFHLTGPLDFRLRAMVADTDDLNDLLQALKTHAGVHQTDSRIVLQHLNTAG